MARDFDPNVISSLTHNSAYQDARLQYEAIRYEGAVKRFKDHQDEIGQGLHTRAAQGYIMQTNGGIQMLMDGFCPDGFTYVPYKLKAVSQMTQPKANEKKK